MTKPEITDMHDPKRQQKILVDTNVISHIAAIPSDKHSKKIKSFQRASKKWWNSIQEFQEFELVISATIWEELSHGGGDDAKRCQDVVKGIIILPSTPEIEKFADDLVDENIFKEKSFKDALIAATGCFYDIDYIVSYNMKDLSNPKKQEELEIAADKISYEAPKLCTPDEFRANDSKSTSSKSAPYHVQDKSSNYGEISYNMNVKERKEYQEPTFTEEQWLKIQEIESSPIFQKCQKISEEICAKYDYDIHKYFEAIRAMPRVPGMKYAEVPSEQDRARVARKVRAKIEAKKLAAAKKAKEDPGPKEYEAPTYTEEQWLKIQEIEKSPIVEECRQIRLKLLAEHDYDIHKLGEAIRAKPRVPGMKYAEIPPPNPKIEEAARKLEAKYGSRAELRKRHRLLARKTIRKQITDKKWLKECEARIAAEKVAARKLKRELKANKEASNKRVVS
ncbi:MAG: type II toxin-antitoxin system VapC family toxin [Candidatus Portiera sp.]|nr:type II toxin-antitoxin system VapC family toxin [Portiera sp.]